MIYSCLKDLDKGVAFERRANNKMKRSSTNRLRNIPSLETYDRFIGLSQVGNFSFRGLGCVLHRKVNVVMQSRPHFF